MIYRGWIFARIVRMKTRFALPLLLLFCLLTIPVSGQDVVSDLLGRINGLRGQLGLPPYALNGALSAAAQSHAVWMATTSQVSHIQNDGSTPRSRAQLSGYPSPMVSENIYMGSLAGIGDAWQFWTNSAVHYAGLTSPNYTEIGIGSATGAGGQSFVLVFGNPSGSYAPVRPAGNSSGASAAAQPQQPSFVVGVDESGNIMHEIQPGDTLGDILLIYGYTWEKLPDILALNQMSEEDVRGLDIGQVLLIPPQAGTYTPMPAEASAEVTEAVSMATLAPAASETPTPISTQVIIPTALPITETFLITPTPTRGMIVSTLPAATSIAANPTPSTQTQPTNSATQTSSAPPLWLIAAIALQVGVLLAASFEFFRRMRQ